MDIEKKLYKDIIKDSCYYNGKIKELLNIETLYLLVHKNEELFISNIFNVNWTTCYVFENKLLAQKYINDNDLTADFKIVEITPDKLKFVLHNYFYKGLTGVIYNCFYKELEQSIYIPIELFYKDIKDTLITTKNKEVISFLLEVLYGNKKINYLFNPLLSPDELILGIIRYFIRTIDKNSYIFLFENREIGEFYCAKSKIKPLPLNNKSSYAKELIKKSNQNVLNEIKANNEILNYPITTINEGFIYHSLKTLLLRERKTYETELEYLIKEESKTISPKQKKKINEHIQSIKHKIDNNISSINVRLYKKSEYIDIKLPIFIQLIVNTGFETIDLS